MTTNLVTEYKYKTKPFKHQLDALAQSATKKNFAYFMEMGCVDGDTEFLTTRGWVKFEDFNLNKWERPLLVAQAVPMDTRDVTNWAIQFAEPEAYIEKDVAGWCSLCGCTSKTTRSGYRFKVDCTLDHTMPHLLYKYINAAKGSDFIREDNFLEQASYICAAFKANEEHLKKYPSKSGLARGNNRVGLISTFKGKALRSKSSYFKTDPELARLSDAELRFMVAVMADGTYPNKTNNKVDFYFIKERKAIRLRRLAIEAGIPLVEEHQTRGSKQLYIFHAIAPIRCKIYDERWYTLKPKQISVIFDEVCFWDGSIFESGEKWFYSVHKESADFIQYVMLCNGLRANIRLRLNPLPIAYTVSGKEYNTSAKGYPVEPVKYVFKNEQESRKAYCFRMPSGFLVLRKEDKIFISGNSGKTKVMLDNIGMLYEKKAITAALVLAPKGVYRNWASKEIPTHLPDTIDTDVLVWDASYSQGYKDRLVKQIREWDGKKLQFLVFNIESLISEKGKKLIVDFIKRHDGNVLALVDESTCIKNHKAKRTKAAIEIGAKCKARRIATGSPVTNSPLDLYAQCAFLDKSLLGCGSYYAFKNTYADIERVQNRMGQHYEKILRYKNLDHLSGLLDKFSFRVTKKECLDLPEKIYMTRDVELTPEQARIYTEMDRYLFSYRKEGEELKEMSASVILTKMLRLHQVLCGSFTDDEGNITRIDNKRVEALKEVLDESSGKVIIWANYLADIDAISEMLTKEYGKDSFVTYYGAVSADDRVRAIERFQDESSPVRFFLGNTQTAGRGITLTAASTVVYYSNNFSLELRQQSEDRAHRLGQRNPVTYIDLVVRGSLDEKIIKSLIEKRNIANEILKDDLESWISLTKE